MDKLLDDGGPRLRVHPGVLAKVLHNMEVGTSFLTQAYMYMCASVCMCTSVRMCASECMRARMYNYIRVCACDSEYVIKAGQQFEHMQNLMPIQKIGHEVRKSEDSFADNSVSNLPIFAFSYHRIATENDVTIILGMNL